MDPEIEELKELVRQNTAIAQDTNRVIHKMRRGAAWGRIISLAFWILLVVVPSVAAYYYFAPYINGLQHLYQSIQSGTAQFK